MKNSADFCYFTQPYVIKNLGVLICPNAEGVVRERLRIPTLAQRKIHLS